MDNEFALTTETENEDIINETDDMKNEPELSQKNEIEVSSDSDEEQQTEPLEEIPSDNVNDEKVNETENKDEFDQLDSLIENLPDNFPKALPIIRSDIAPQLIKMEGGLLEYYIEKLRKQTKVSKQTIKEEIKATKNIQDSLGSDDAEDDGQEDEETDPEVLELANQIAQDPLLFKNRIDDVQNLGVVRERRNIGLSACAIDSRLLIGEPRKSETFNMKISGPQGSGKSSIILKTLDLYPKNSHIIITGGSDMSIIYEKDVKHKALIITEAIQLESNNGNDNIYAFVLRSVINDNFFNYKTTRVTKYGRITIPIKLIGPTSLLTTTTKDKLEKQLDDRLATVKPEMSSEKTTAILKMSGKRAAGKAKIIDEIKIRAWKHHNASLKPYNVIVPFGEEIADLVTLSSGYPHTIHRGFERFTYLIKSIAIAYQHQRKIDEQGYLLAEYSDYFLAHQLMEHIFRENLSDEKYTDNRIRYIHKNGPMKPKDIASAFGISGAAVTGWMKNWIEKGVLIWVDEKDNEFSNDESLKKAKHSGKAFLKSVGTAGLPTTFELTQDPRWDVGGEYYQMYDLEFECDDDGVMSLDEDEISDGLLNTPDDSYSNDDIGDNGNSGKGVKVLNKISHKDTMNMIRESAKNQEPCDPNDPETQKLYDEFGQFLMVKPDERVPTNNKL